MSTTDIAVIDRGAGTGIAQMQARSALIRQVMANVLEEGKDYGKIPGTDKPTLFKPGAEKLCLTFALGAVAPTVDDLSTSDAVRYRVSVPIEAADGRILAVGIGEASTDEEKYRWRKPVCDEEFEETPAELRRLKWFRGREGGYQGKQVRTSPADLANTVLKMAHKRAFVGGTLLATGASSVFNQDIEDFAEELRENVIADEGEPAAPKAVKRASDKKAAPAPEPKGLATEPRALKDIRVFGKDKNNYAVVLVGDPQEYTTKDAALALELEQFKGTDHPLRITYEDNPWQGKIYHNIKSFAVVEPVAQAAAATATAPMPTAGDIPFGK
jgi:hypothetical protein